MARTNWATTRAQVTLRRRHAPLAGPVVRADSSGMEDARTSPAEAAAETTIKVEVPREAGRVEEVARSLPSVKSLEGGNRVGVGKLQWA